MRLRFAFYGLRIDEKHSRLGGAPGGTPGGTPDQVAADDFW